MNISLLELHKMIKPAEFIHPEDAAALRQMENIPGFPTLVKKIMAPGFEQYEYGVNMRRM